MIFRVQFKDPDTLGDAIQDAVKEEVDKLPLSDDEKKAVEAKRREAVSAMCSRWFRWGEYVVIEIDTEAGTAVVVPEK